MSSNRLNSSQLGEYEKMLKQLKVPELKTIIKQTTCSQNGRKVELIGKILEYIRNNPHMSQFRNQILEFYKCVGLDYLLLWFSSQYFIQLVLFVYVCVLNIIFFVFSSLTCFLQLLLFNCLWHCGLRLLSYSRW